MTIPSTLKAVTESLAKRRIWIILPGLAIAFFFSAVALMEPQFLKLLNNKLYDSMLSAGARNYVSKIPVIIDIDEKSLAGYGQWPWPRYRLAKLLDEVREAGAASVSLDIIFAEPDRTSPAELKKQLRRDLNISMDLKNLPAKAIDNDRTLALALSQSPAVLGYKFTFGEESQQGPGCSPRPLKAAISRESEEAGPGLPHRASGIICNLPELSDAVSASGFLNVRPDADGTLRRAPLVIEYENNYYPSLALATLLKTGGPAGAALKISSHGLEAVILDNTSIPVDPQGNMLINFPKNRLFDRISASDILTGRFEKARLKGRIAIIGVSASGLGDLHTVPNGDLLPGAEAHATIIDNIILRDYVYSPGWIKGIESITVMALGILATILIAWSGAWRSFLVLSALSLGILLGSEWALWNKGIFISPLVPIIAIACIMSFLTLFKYWIKEREIKESVRRNLRTQDFTILCLSSLIETRDEETGNHTMRCRHYVRALCRQLMANPEYSGRISEEDIEQFAKSAPLHDIGKIGEPDSLLHKPSRLTDQEYEEIKKHTIFGYCAIERAERLFGKELDTSFLDAAKAMIISHHEKWDGTGYPYGLSGDNIPLAGRVMAIADVYDALISKRVYKRAYTHNEAVAVIARDRGSHFDPDMVDAFAAVNEQFKRIAENFPDNDLQADNP
jgi:adenylate cyclase